MIVGAKQMKTQKFLLPFAVHSGNHAKAFEKEKEMGAVFCIAELERRKGSGVILRKPAEELLFIAEVCYPIWLISWETKSLLFDGLGIAEYTLPFDRLPDVKAFLNEAEGSTEVFEIYSAFLSANANYFQRFTGREERKTEGLITNPDFIQNFVSCLPEAIAVKKPMSDKIFLAPIIDESSILSSIHELSNLVKVTLKEEVNTLHRSMQLLSTATHRHTTDIKDEIRQIQSEFQEKIAEIEDPLMEKLREIKLKIDEEIVMLSKRFDERLQNLNQKHVELDKTMQSLIVRMECCETEIKSDRLQRDEADEFHRMEELKKFKNELSNLQKSAKVMNEELANLEASKKLEISKLRSEYDQQAEDAKGELRKLEASRDTKIRMKQLEIRSLEDLTAKIIDQIYKLAGIKESAIDDINKLGTKSIEQKKAIVYLPLYLVCYKAGAKKHYVVYPPSMVKSIGIPTKFKGFFGGSKIKSLFEHRSNPITNLLNDFVSVIGRNPVFEKDLVDSGMGTSILGTKESKDKIRIGIEKLKKEGWISESELKAFVNILTKS